MTVTKARLFPLLFIFFSSSVLLACLSFTFGEESLRSTTEYDTDCIARICKGAAGVDLQSCKDQAEYCEVVPEYKKPMFKLAQCQQRCEEMKEPRQMQQCQSRCLQKHQQYQQCMQICQGSGTTAARSREVCRKVCLREQGGEYYLNLWYSNPDYDKGRVHKKCMDRCKTSQEPQLCMRICKPEHREKEERETFTFRSVRTGDRQY